MSEQNRVQSVLIVLAWLWVLIPFSYGGYQLLVKIPALFG
ncbi:MFS transporter small subunit [Pseudonocardia sp.]